LKEFPFETGNLFEQEVIDDLPLLEKLLRLQMRTQWPNRYGHRLETLLALSTFSAGADGFVTLAINLAQRLSGDPSREVLIPDPARIGCRQPVAGGSSRPYWISNDWWETRPDWSRGMAG
jgi:hypothetical protein